jgi:hypothetical protein
MKRIAIVSLLIASAAFAPLTHAHHEGAASEASALSAVPIAVSVAAPVMLISGGVVLSVVAVEASATGTVWVLERASDGARATVKLSGEAAVGLSVAAGTIVTVTAISAGWVLSTASEVIAYIPNEIGQALLYNERITR